MHTEQQNGVLHDSDMLVGFPLSHDKAVVSWTCTCTCTDLCATFKNWEEPGGQDYMSAAVNAYLYMYMYVCKY